MGPDCTDFFFKEQLPQVGFHFCFTRAVLSPGWPAVAGGGAGRRAAPRGAGTAGGSGDTHSGFCAVLGKPIRWSPWLRSQEADDLPFREQRMLFALGLQIFCLLTLVLFIVHDYGQLGCHFFQIPV